MNQSTLMNRMVNIFVIATILLLAPVLLAGPETYEYPKDGKEIIPPPEIQPWCETPASLEIRIGIPGWLSNLSGDFGVKGIVAPLDVSVDKLIQHMDALPIVLSAYVRYNRWEIFADGEDVQVSSSAELPGLLFTNANIHAQYAFWEGFIGYRLINCQKASLSLYAGARYNYMSSDMQIANNQDPRFPVLRKLLGIPNSLEVSGSIDWVDPVVGLGGRVHIWKPVSFWVNGDVGGFDANSGSAFALSRQGGTPVLTSVSSSDWSYQIQGGLEFQLSHSMWSQVGWRYLKYDYNISGFTNKTALNGPFIQTGINF